MTATTGLTPMERSLLASLEELTGHFESSLSRLSDLEMKSRKLQNTQLDILQTSVSELVNSQTVLATCLEELATGSNNYSKLRNQLNESLEALKRSEKRLRRN